MDAVSVSVASGVRSKHADLRHALKVGLFFGGFQAGMPLIGWAVGSLFSGIIDQYSNWVGFVLLTIIGLKMIQESFGDAEDNGKNLLNTKTLIALSVATSIDALIVGVTLHLIDVPLLIAVAVIGIVTFILSALGFLFGKKLGTFFQGKIEIVGGIALIAIGVKLLFS